MTVGIYKLIFNNTDKVYIGQSINIERRFTTHLNELKNNTHSIKLQEAYNLYGAPSLEVLDISNDKELDILEEYYINKYNSCNCGFNTAAKASGGISIGENNGVSKYSNEQIIEAVTLMVEFPDISLKVLADTIDISWDTIKQISRGVQYKWVKDIIPETYDKLMSLKGTRAGISNSAKSRGITYPAIKSPDGTVYNVYNCSEFSKIHNLTSSNLIQILKGNRKTHKGWKLA